MDCEGDPGLLPPPRPHHHHHHHHAWPSSQGPMCHGTAALHDAAFAWPPRLLLRIPEAAGTQPPCKYSRPKNKVSGLVLATALSSSFWPCTSAPQCCVIFVLEIQPFLLIPSAAPATSFLVDAGTGCAVRLCPRDRPQPALSGSHTLTAGRVSGVQGHQWGLIRDGPGLGPSLCWGPSEDLPILHFRPLGADVSEGTQHLCPQSMGLQSVTLLEQGPGLTLSPEATAGVCK